MPRRRRLFPGKRRASRGRDQTDPRIFATRHRFLLVLLLAQVPALALVGLARGVPISEVVAGTLIVLVTAVAGLAARSRLVGAGAVSLGLVTTAGILVRHLEGSPESFIAFFLALVAISFYRDTRLLVVGLVYVIAFHVFALLSLYRESIIFRAGVIDMPLPIVAVTLDAVLVLLLIAGWRLDRRVETRREAAGNLFRVGFERSSIGMGALTPSGDFILANEALTRMLGPVDGANVRSVIHADDLEMLGQLWEDMGQTETRVAESWLRFRTADGRAIWGMASLSFTRAAPNRPAMILFQLMDGDAGHREQARLQTELAGRDDFVAAIAADIKEPIRSILDLTTAAAGDPIDLNRIVRHVDDEARRVASIVDDLIMSAGAGSAPVVNRSIDAELVCREVLAQLPNAGEVIIAVGAERFWADPGLTLRILATLVTNAVRYGGRVVSLEVSGSGPDTVVSVIDDGPAVPVPERDRMFEADLRSGSEPTRPAAVGLSLTVARRLARQMDGEITYRRTGDGRNVFELRLPAEPVRLDLASNVEPEAMRIPA